MLLKSSVGADDDEREELLLNHPPDLELEDRKPPDLKPPDLNPRISTFSKKIPTQRKPRKNTLTILVRYAVRTN